MLEMKPLSDKLALGISVLLLTVAIASTANAAPFALYTFEGNAQDVSGNGYHGVLGPIPPTITGSGYEGSAYQFGSGGLDTYITLPININPGVMPALTMGLWANADIADATIRGILSHDNGLFDRTLDVDTRNCAIAPCWSAFNGSGVVSSGITVIPGQWVFLAVRYDQAGNTVVLNVDGAQFISAGTLGTGFSVTTIGRNPGYDLPFMGRIDNVFFFDDVLSDARLEEIRLGGSQAILESTQIPEPGAFGLVAAGLLALVFARRCRRQA